MIYFFAGDNKYLIKASVDKLTLPIIKEAGDLAVEKLDAEETSISAVIDSIKSPPFLVSQKCVVVQNANDKDLLEKILNTDPIDSITAVVIISKLDKRANYYKLLQKNKNFSLFEQAKVNNISNWVVNYVKDLGGNINRIDANYLIDRVGSNQILLTNELNKLYLYQTNITKETINLLTFQRLQATTFQLLETAFNGQLSKTQQLFIDLKMQKIEPTLIIGAIAWQLHLLVLVKLSGNKSPETIAKELKISQFSVAKTKSLASRIIFTKLKKLVMRASELDLSIKTQYTDSEQAILLFLAQLS